MHGNRTRIWPQQFAELLAVIDRLVYRAREQGDLTIGESHALTKDLGRLEAQVTAWANEAHLAGLSRRATLTDVRRWNKAG